MSNFINNPPSNIIINNLSNKLNLNHTYNISRDLLKTYEKVMVLKIFIDSDDNELKNTYYGAANNHNNKLHKNPLHIDAGFDLFAPKDDSYINGDELRFLKATNPGMNAISNKLDYQICCSARMINDRGKEFNTGYYMYPRSSISKTPLRLANSTGIIDSGYRGHLMAMFDVVPIPQNIINDAADFCGKKFDRYAQICAPGLVPIVIEIVERKDELGEETERGDGGFGSTGR